MHKLLLPCLLTIILLPTSIFATSNPDNKTLQLKIAAGEKLRTKIDEVFAHTPKLRAIYNKTLNMELSRISNLSEYKDLLRSKELKILNNSPEMQESLKETINEVNTRIHEINQKIDFIRQKARKMERELSERYQEDKDEISIRDIKKNIYAHDAVINELKQGISNAMEDFNKQQELYFPDAKGFDHISSLSPIQKPDTLTTDSLLTSIINLDQIIDTRITAVITNNEGVGVSSGDEYAQSGGLWIKGLKSYAKQNEYHLTHDYKSDLYGGVIGLDFIDNIIGISYAFIQNDISTNIIGTKERIKSHIGTIYGVYKFNSSLFIDMQGRYGRSYINKSRNNLNLSNDVSYAKTEGDIYGGKLELGFNYVTGENIHIVPTIGVTYDALQIEGYHEIGTGLNRKVAGRKVSKTACQFGARISKVVEINSFMVIPEIYIKSLNIIDSSNDETTITILTGAEPLITPSDKLHKTIYKIGGALKISRTGEPVDIEVGYDFGKSKKFYSHTGYISSIIEF